MLYHFDNAVDRTARVDAEKRTAYMHGHIKQTKASKAGKSRIVKEGSGNKSKIVNWSSAIVLLSFVFVTTTTMNAQTDKVFTARYLFNGNTNDESGNRNHGSIVIVRGKDGPTLTEDRFGNRNSAYRFNGYYNHSYIKVPHSSSLKFTNKMTISLWYKPTDWSGMDGLGRFTNNAGHTLISKGGDRGGWWLDISATHIGFTIKNIPGLASRASFDVRANNIRNIAGEWIHIAVVVDTNSLELFKNGKSISTTKLSGVIATLSDSYFLSIGNQNPAGPWYPCNGIIDDVEIYYDKALTSFDVTQSFKNTNSPVDFNLTLRENDGLSGTTTGSGKYTSGTKVIISANNNTGYNFLYWKDNFEKTISYNPIDTVTLISDSTIIAVFEKVVPKICELDVNKFDINIEFQFGKHTLTDNGKKVCKEIVEELKKCPDVHIKIIGHTDSVGTIANNQILSENRAKSVRDELVKLGLDANRVDGIAGKGKSEPISKEQARNRRVEFIIIRK